MMGEAERWNNSGKGFSYNARRCEQEPVYILFLTDDDEIVKVITTIPLLQYLGIFL